MYQVRDIQKSKYLNFRLCDTPGLEEDQGLDSHEICYVLDGKVPDRYMFNPSLPFAEKQVDDKPNPRLADRIHVVAFVLDASTVYVMSEKVLEKIKALQLKMNLRGIPQVVILTKIDKISESLTDDVSKIFNVPVIKDCIDRVSQIIGLPRSHILPVKNYEQEAALDENINILALLAMQQILRFADDFLYNEFEHLCKEIEKQNRKWRIVLFCIALLILCVSSGVYHYM
ncbi:hypothetical protein FSP39_003648 [Pinctada imbricata]|uniref:Interferon-induced protein 44-like protein n=1 Tax=Pinctada imbricata TaxID=66713 RepID=A0AA88YIR6_PINIB|nr:hypothetical protein FSP39_003648 [Pinctada imbricata]